MPFHALTRRSWLGAAALATATACTVRLSPWTEVASVEQLSAGGRMPLSGARVSRVPPCC